MLEMSSLHQERVGIRDAFLIDRHHFALTEVDASANIPPFPTNSSTHYSGPALEADIWPGQKLARHFATLCAQD